MHSPVMANSSWHHALQHARLPCPKLSSKVCLNSCPLNQWCRPTISSSVTPFSSCPQSFPTSGSFLISRSSIRGPTYLSFSFSISPSNEYSGLISFTIDWFDLFATQGTLKSLLQHHSSKASILQCSVFFMVQLSDLCVTTGETIALTVRNWWTFVGKVMSAFSYTKFVLAFLPKSKGLLISWQQSLSAGILEPKKIKYATIFTFSPFKGTCAVLRLVTQFSL